MILVVLVALGFAGAPAGAQQSSSTSTRQGAVTPAAQAPVLPNSSQSGTATIEGTIADTNHDVLQGAKVAVANGDTGEQKSAESGSDGQFTFSGLPAGTYTVTVSGAGLSPYKLDNVSLQPGQVRILPEITVSLSAAATSVRVTADKEELAQEQVQIAVEQRVFKVIPNFYSAYDWNAPPMGAKQKFHLSLRSLVDPVSFLSVAGIAGAEQYQNVFPAYGSGIEGYSKRYGAAFANHVSGDLLSDAVYPSIFHQDPRYFYKGKGSVASRALYAMSRAVVTRSDSGHWEPNYSQVLGNFSAGAISNLYYPESDRGLSLTLLNGLADTGADAVENLIREFVLKDITSHVSKSANGQP